MTDAYPFVDLRPRLRFSRAYWERLPERERHAAITAANSFYVLIEIIDDAPPPAEKP